MALDITYAANSVTFGATVWDSTDGGPIRVQVVTTTNVVHTHVAGDFQSSDAALTNQTTEVLVDLSQFTPDTLPTINDENSIVLSLKKSDGTAETETLYRCKYAGLTNQEQTRDNASTSAARFIYNAGGTEKDIYTT